MKTSNFETVSMAAFRKSISGCLSESGNDVTDSADSTPIVKKKLCRVSDGCANSHRSLLVLKTKNDIMSENSASYTFSEGVARDIGGGDHLVEICVVRSSAVPLKGAAERILPTGEAQHQEVDDINGNHIADSNDKEIDDRLNTEEEILSTDANSFRKRRVAFSDDVTIHSFENDDEISTDMDCDSIDDLFPDENENPQNENKNCSVSEETHCNFAKYSDLANGESNVSSIQAVARPLYTKKMPLRRAIINQVTRACSTANLLRTFLRESFRRPNSFPHGTKTRLDRSRSLPESSIRHSFISADDHNGPVVQLVIALGQHFTPNDISVKTSGDGKKIKVLASQKRSGTDLIKRDYHEWFYMPKPIDPRQTRATVNYEGFLKIAAPFIA
nr:small heat shock protein [Ailoscolex lacteospumosus]